MTTEWSNKVLREKLIKKAIYPSMEGQLLKLDDALALLDKQDEEIEAMLKYGAKYHVSKYAVESLNEVVGKDAI